MYAIAHRRRLQENKDNIDTVLLEHFEQEIWNKVPHFEKSGAKVVNATPLIDITIDLKELAKKGMVSESLNDGINALSQGKGKHISELIQIARE